MATAVWCASGVVTTASPDATSVRLVVPAHLGWWLAGAALGALIPSLRRTPWRAAPALLSTLPWWPLPLPAAAMIWTGHLAWLPILVTLAAAVWPGRPARRPAPVRPERVPGGHVLAAGAATLVVALGAAVLLDDRLPGGDEPHYLVITQSLIADGDLAIENNHQRRDYRTYFNGDLRPDYLRRGSDGQIYSIHAPGTSVLVLPAFAAFGYRGAQATMVLVAALTGVVIWLVGFLATRDIGAAWFGWAAVACSVTFVLQTVMVFPDGPGALGTAIGLLVLLRLSRGRPVSGVALVGTSAVLAALPWLHTRFVVISAVLGVLIGWRILGDASAAARRPARLTLFAVVPAVGAVAWFWFFWATYGTPNPAAPYGPSPETRLAYVPGGMLAVLFDAQFGLMAYTPVLLLAAWPWGAGRRTGTPLGAGLGAAAVYLAAVGTYWMWWAGVPATPARFATAILPAFAAPVAVAWQQAGRLGRGIAGWLLALSLAFTVGLLILDGGGLAWNVRLAPVQWIAWLGSAADLARGLPSFFWALTPGEVRTEGVFVVHVALVLGLGVGVTVGARRLFARRAPDAALAGGLWLLVVVTAIIQAGWWWTGATGIDAARSQQALLREVGRGRAAYRLETGRVERVEAISRGLRMRIAQSNGLRPPELAAGEVGALPAGVYEVTVTAAAPVPDGALTVRLSRTAEPLATLSLSAAGEASAVVTLPNGAAGLLVQPNAALAKVGRSVELTPLRVERRP